MKRPGLLKVLLAGLAVLLVIVVALCFIGRPRVYSFPSSSMAPTVLPGDKVLGIKSPGKVEDLPRGTIVIFEPAQVAPSLSGIFMKRLVALPGDRIDLVNGELQLNGHAFEERDGKHPIPARQGLLPPNVKAPTYPLTIPEGHAFVLGDNYGNSLDSRYFGPIPFRSIFKIANLRVSPLNRSGRIE